MHGAGHWAAAARAIAGGDIDRCAVETEGFRFGQLTSFWDGDFLPGAVKYGDLNGLLVQSAPRSLWVKDKDETLRANLTAAYATTNSAGSLLMNGEDVVGYLTTTTN
jgi:hypothetical protein